MKFHKKTEKKTSYQDLHLTNVSVTTTEEIQPSYIKDFLKTNIEKSKLTINSNSKAFYSYFKEINLYEIYYLENFSKETPPIHFIFLEKHNDKYIELFIIESHFILICYGELKLIKELNSEVIEDEILSFLLERYKIKVDKIYKYSTQELEMLNKTIYKKDKKLPKLISLKKDNSLNYLFSFVSIILLIPLIHFNLFHNSKNSNTIKKEISTLEKKYLNLVNNKNKKKSKLLISTYFQIKQYENLVLKSFILNKNKLQIFLESSYKSKLITFIEKYNGKLIVDKINFNPQNKKYILEALIVI